MRPFSQTAREPAKRRVPTALERAVDYLSRRLVPAQRVRWYLRRKGYEPSQIDAALERLVSQGLLDEPALALSRARQLAGRKGYWGWALAARLRRDGFDEPSRRRALEALADAGGAEARARGALTRQYGEGWADAPPRRLAGFLERRGYPAELIARLLGETRRGA